MSGMCREAQGLLLRNKVEVAVRKENLRAKI